MRKYDNFFLFVLCILSLLLCLTLSHSLTLYVVCAYIYSLDGFLPILCVHEIYDRDVYFERVAVRFHVAQKKRC